MRKHMPYYGGKSPNTAIGKWIISLLPWRFESTYMEPFAGMLGILMGRDRVKSEIINDLDGNVYNWWTQVRDNTDELGKLIQCTPFSRQALMDAHVVLTNPGDHSPVKRAAALHTLLHQGIYRRIGKGKPSWRISVNPSGGRGTQYEWHHIMAMGDRIKNVQVENRDALDLLERGCEEPNAVIYCDPPYRTADTSAYGEREADWGRMGEILKTSKAQVAVSGYGDEWDSLGWLKREKEVNLAHIHGREVRKVQRVECLWMNYQPAKHQESLDV